MAIRNIVLMGGPPVIHEEEKATEAIDTGHIVQYVAGGFRKNQENAATCAMMVALERDELGKPIEPTASGVAGAGSYASGDTVKVGILRAGMRYYAWIPSGQNIAKGAYLAPDATGCLTATGVTATIRTAVAVEAVNNSAGPGNARIRVQVL